MKAIIVIPAYNEELNLPGVMKDIQTHCPGMDYVIINDGSTDGTRALCEREHYNHVNLLVNLGFSGAVQTGYKYVLENNFDVAIQFDGDGQHSASVIPEMLRLIARGEADYVVGSRFVKRKRPGSLRMSGARLIWLLVFLRTGKKITDPTSGMRAINRAVVKHMAEKLNFVAEPDTLTRVLLKGWKVREVQVDMKPRLHGVSHFKNPLRGIEYMLRMIVSILFFQGKEW
jgi:glycosyltransferase involved in cell wall biosynthesis